MKHLHGFIDGEYQDGELRGLSFQAGTRGFGKTTEMSRLLAMCRGGALFFDSLSKHSLNGFTTVSQPGELKRTIRRSPSRFHILYQPRCGDIDAHFDAFCSIALAVGKVIIAVDEIDKLCGTRWGESRMPKRLYDIVNYGRHYRISLTFTARRPAQVPRGLTSECWEMRLFHIHENRDVAYFAEYIGDDTARKLRTLPKYQYLLWHNDGSQPQLRGGRH